MKPNTNKMLYDFVCTCGLEFEEFVYSGEREATCPNCHSAAARKFPSPRIDKLGMSMQVGATPTSIDYFDKLHQQQRKIEERKHEDHGDYGVAPGSGGGGSYKPFDTEGMTVRPVAPKPTTP